VVGWGTRLALYGAGIAAGWGFAALFTGGALWYVLGAALVGLIVGSSGAFRFVLLVPVAGLYALLVVHGAPPLSIGGWRRLLAEIGTDLYQAAGIMYANPVPYDLHPGILFMALPVVVLVVAFATSATLYEESPVISVAVLGLAIGVLGTVTFEVGIALPFALFLICAIALLLLSNGSSEETGDSGADGRLARTQGLRATVPRGGAWVLASVVVGVALLLPALPFARELVRPAAIDWTRIGAGDTSRLAVEVDVGDYLTVGRDAELFRVRSSEPLYWRGGTSDYFDGVRWTSTVKPGQDDGEEIDPRVETRQVYQEVEVLQAETNLLFGGYRIAGAALPSGEAIQRSDGSWESPKTLVEGSTYRVLSDVPQPTAAQLLGAGTAYPREVREKFLQLPDNRPAVLDQTADLIRRNYNTRTPYQSARAVERYLLYDGGFTYNLDANYTRADRALEEFLSPDGKREGFCTQFATSMALILRELDVPTRVVYGAATGEQVRPGEYVVTGYNMHTWVEVYFPGVGWYPFDPTPGFSVPQTMQANAPRPVIPPGSGGISPENPALRRQLAEPQGQTPREEEPAPTNDSAGATPDQPEDAPPLWPVIPVVSVLLVASVPLAKRLLAARRRPEDLYRDLAGRLRDALAPGAEAARLATSPALTPSERLLLLAGAVGVEEEPFREFARAYSERLYARDPKGNLDRAYRRALRSYGGLPPWRRALAALNPASLALGFRRTLVSRAGRLVKSLRLALRGIKRRR
jgi:transglutaminase-like putative cysteine protease